MHLDQRQYVLNSRKQASMIQSRPVKNIRKVGKKEQNEETALIHLHVNARLQLIICFKRRTSHELNFNTRFQLPSSLRAFDAVPRREQVCTRNQQNTNCTYRLNLL